MKLYIANCTQQVQMFHYRVLERTGVRVQEIPIGGQVQLSGDFSTPQIQDIVVDQHAKYGLISVDEIDRTRPFIGTCYSVDKPVPVGKLQYAIQHNTGVLDARGRVIRKEAAVAISATVESALQRATSPDQEMEQVDVSITEEKQGSGPAHTPVDEGFRVTRNDDRRDPPPRKRGRRAA